MDRQDVEKTVTEYLKPIFGFALKRCKTVHDAEDLSQEIAVRAFRALLIRDDIADMRKFIWTVAHNALSNYYRDAARSMVGISIEEAAELIADPCFETDADEYKEAVGRIQTEIAYLSKLQRRIVIAYYFENRRQADIAGELGIPVGTVKWHLFEAKKELKRGMDMTRKTGELKFNPIKFHSYGINGAPGKKSSEEFFRSALSQNICYCIRNSARTVAEIADELGVSPVYVESEVEFLEKYGFLKVQKNKYIANFIISEITAELLTQQADMYRRAAELFADDLYDELTSSGILEDPGILCGQTDGTVSPTDVSQADQNFLLWALIPYIAAWSGDRLQEKRISFEEAATIRPDGAYNIFSASVLRDEKGIPEEYLQFKNNGCGHAWNDNGRYLLWQLNSEWAERGEYNGFQYAEDARRILSLYEREKEERLSKDEYAWLAERGVMKTTEDFDGSFKAVWQIVFLENKEIQNKLIAMGVRIREKHRAEFEALKAPYAEARLKSVPAHLRKIEEFNLQFLFCSDGCFLVYCMMVLLENGRLKKPTEDQRKALTTLIANV